MNVKSMSVDELREFARRDDCLDQMVPSDLRELISHVFRSGYFACREDMKQATRSQLATPDK